MPWIKKAKRVHQCRTPWLLPWRRVDSEWACPKCGSQYYIGEYANAWNGSSIKRWIES